jgi:hypothetical protein
LDEVRGEEFQEFRRGGSKNYKKQEISRTASFQSNAFDGGLLNF